MWLLNTQSTQLEHFHDDQRPPYAILSHTWAHDEVTFDMMRQAEGSKEKLWSTAGWYKIDACCQQAIKDGFKYVWIDTCCIDKASSAELSEAINSMYRWYAEAAVCYAFLSDVHEKGIPRRDAALNPQTANTGKQRRSLRFPKITNSRWFERGWTLQELLAPAQLHFYGIDWQYLGSKRHQSKAIANRTRIPQAALTSFKPHDHPIATRMSWAALRSTTRIEDRAYSLMGLFEVNIPLIYGEGPKAFMRLQEEIMRASNDMSIFAWVGTSDSSFGMLASTPDCFVDSHDVLPEPEMDAFDPSKQYELSKAGITGSFHLWHYVLNVFIAGVAQLPVQNTSSSFSERSSENGSVFCIFLEQRADHTFQRITLSGNNCVRLNFDQLDEMHDIGKRKIQITRAPSLTLRISHLRCQSIEAMAFADDDTEIPELPMTPGVLYRNTRPDSDKQLPPAWTRVPSSKNGTTDLLRVHLPKINDVHGCIMVGSSPGFILWFHKRPLIDGSYEPAVLCSRLINASTRHSGKVSRDHICCEAGCVELFTRISNTRGITTSFRQTANRLFDRMTDSRWDEPSTQISKAVVKFTIGNFLTIELPRRPDFKQYVICNLLPNQKEVPDFDLVLPNKLPKSVWVFDFDVRATLDHEDDLKFVAGPADSDFRSSYYNVS